MEKKVEDAVKKFVKIPTGIMSTKEIVGGGYMTEQELSLIKDAPRSKEMESASRWSRVSDGDKSRSLYPLYSLLREDEKEIYRAYRKEHPAGTQGGVEETTARVEALVKELRALGVPEETIKKAEALMPKRQKTQEERARDKVLALKAKLAAAGIDMAALLSA